MGDTLKREFQPGQVVTGVESQPSKPAGYFEPTMLTGMGDISAPVMFKSVGQPGGYSQTGATINASDPGSSLPPIYLPSNETQPARPITRPTFLSAFLQNLGPALAGGAGQPGFEAGLGGALKGIEEQKRSRQQYGLQQETLAQRGEIAEANRAAAEARQQALFFQQQLLQAGQRSTTERGQDIRAGTATEAITSRENMKIQQIEANITRDERRYKAQEDLLAKRMNMPQGSIQFFTDERGKLTGDYIFKSGPRAGQVFRNEDIEGMRTGAIPAAELTKQRSIPLAKEMAGRLRSAQTQLESADSVVDVVKAWATLRTNMLLFSQVARGLGGEVGVLTEQDIARVQAAMPGLLALGIASFSETGKEYVSTQLNLLDDVIAKVEAYQEQFKPTPRQGGATAPPAGSPTPPVRFTPRVQ